MAHSSWELASRFRNCIRQWLQSRMQECVHCCECDNPVKPWDTVCPNCGQEGPSRLSASTSVYLVLGLVLLALTLSSLVSAF